MKPEEQQQKVAELRHLMESVPPLKEEPDYITSQDTLERFLRAREWKVNDAEKLLKSAVGWRRGYKPLSSDCKWCHEKPGFHCMRQVGFDIEDRPVIYSCFAQAQTHKNVVEDSVAHCTYIIENAKRTMKKGNGKLVWVIDCTGMTLACCNPKLGHGCMQVFANCFPERLGLVIVINHSPVFQGVWKALKVFMDPNTVAKIVMERSKDKIKESFKQTFPDELCEWLSHEMKLNKQKPLCSTQKKFWEAPPDPETHDPRGCPSYTKEYMESLKSPCPLEVKESKHKPHPNIVDEINGTLKDFVPLSPDQLAKQVDEVSLDTSDEWEEIDEFEGQNGAVSDLDIPDEYKIQPAMKTYL